MYRMIPAILLIVCFSRFCGLSQGGAVFEAAMVRYVNPNGRDSSGDQCDYVFSTACDHRFTICFDEPAGPSTMSPCPYGRFTSQVFNGQNTVVFGSSLGSGVSNPIILHLDNWPGGIKMKVHVVDSDSSSGDDSVDDLFVTYTMTPYVSLAFASPRAVTMSGIRTKTTATRLEVEFVVYCDENFYGANCATFCRETDDVTGHYVCDPNGQMVCRPGWEGLPVNCTIYSDDCRDVICQNGGSCIDGNQTYSCACADGYTGVHCEQDIDDCARAPCQHNGTCEDGVNSFVCSCAAGYLGEACEFHVCNVSVTCLNNGSCVGDGQCACPNGFTGSLCEVNMCDSVTCQNNGTCYQGSCICPPGVAGHFCSVDLCDYIYCQHGATCIEGACECPLGFVGARCEENIDECLSNPCGRTGICEDVVDGFICHCAERYTGELCETALEVITYPDFHLPDQAQVSIAAEQALPDYGLALLAVATVLVFIMLLWLVARCYASRRLKELADSNQYDNPAFGRQPSSSTEHNNNVANRQLSRDTATQPQNEARLTLSPDPKTDCKDDQSRITFNTHDSNDSVSYIACEDDVVCDVTVTSFENPIYDTLPVERPAPSVVDQVVADGLIRDKDSADDVVLIPEESESEA